MGIGLEVVCSASRGVHRNRVEEFDFESETRRQLAGNIYLAKVMNYFTKKDTGYKKATKKIYKKKMKSTLNKISHLI